jgi:hypothetical protein
VEIEVINAWRTFWGRSWRTKSDLPSPRGGHSYDLFEDGNAVQKEHEMRGRGNRARYVHLPLFEIDFGSRRYERCRAVLMIDVNRS